MIRSVLTLRAREGRLTAVEEFYGSRGILDRARLFPGCRGTNLWRIAGSGSADSTSPGASPSSFTHLVIADWDSAAAYAGWVADPWRAEVAADLAELLDLSQDKQMIAGLLEPVDVGPISWRAVDTPSQPAGPKS